MQLTNLQKQICFLVYKGCTNKEIANRLNYSKSNIATNLGYCFKFFNVKNRAEMIRKIGNYINKLIAISIAKEEENHFVDFNKVVFYLQSS